MKKAGNKFSNSRNTWTSSSFHKTTGRILLTSIYKLTFAMKLNFVRGHTFFFLTMWVHSLQWGPCPLCTFQRTCDTLDILDISNGYVKNVYEHV